MNFFERSGFNEMKNEKNYMGFHIQKIWQSVSLGYLKVENKPRISEDSAPSASRASATLVEKSSKKVDFSFFFKRQKYFPKLHFFQISAHCVAFFNCKSAVF